MIYAREQKELEKRYGCVIAQFICEELEKTERLDQKMKEKQLVEGFGANTIFYKAA